MYAIIRSGGKQLKVSEGDVVAVERLRATDEVTFTPLLVVAEDGTVISGRDELDKAKVVAEILGEVRGDKIDIFKYKPKSGYRRRQGHRQVYTNIRVTKIEIPGAKKAGKRDAAPVADEPGDAPDEAVAAPADKET